VRGARPARVLGAGLMASIWLASCATPSLAPAERSYSGRFSATTASITPQGEQRETVSGRFVLEVRGERQLLELASPLGTTVARIEMGPGEARASGTQFRDVRGADADALTELLLGWRLPVSGLSEWIEGRPVRDRPSRVERQDGRVVLIEQDGWTIRLPEASGFEATRRARRLLIERTAAASAPSVVLRVVLDAPDD